MMDAEEDLFKVSQKTLRRTSEKQFGLLTLLVSESETKPRCKGIIAFVLTKIFIPIIYIFRIIDFKKAVRSDSFLFKKSGTYIRILIYLLLKNNLLAQTSSKIQTIQLPGAL